MSDYKFFDECEALKDTNLVREKLIEEALKPVCVALLKKHPEFKSITVSCASYYSDNATDEIHWRFIPSSEKNPACWNDLFNSKKNKIFRRDILEAHDEYPEESRVSWDDILYSYGQEEFKAALGGWYPYFGADFFTEGLVPYCKEGSDQESSDFHNFTEFMVANRGGRGKINFRMVGDVKRVWK